MIGRLKKPDSRRFIYLILFASIWYIGSSILVIGLDEHVSVKIGLAAVLFVAGVGVIALLGSFIVIGHWHAQILGYSTQITPIIRAAGILDALLQDSEDPNQRQQAMLFIAEARKIYPYLRISEPIQNRMMEVDLLKPESDDERV